MRLRSILLVLSVVIPGFVQASPFAFGKRADEAKIREILTLSRVEKIQKIQENGVKVEAHVFEDSRLLGQFLDQGHFPELQQPVIWLSEKADEWTLVHEYIHFLFSQSPSVHQEIISEAEHAVALELLTRSWRNYTENQWRYHSPQHRDTVTSAFLQVATAQMQQLESFELEELAIESYLREVYQKQKPVGFTEEAWSRSKAYMRKSASAALARMKDLAVSCSELERSYERENEVIPSALKQICQTLQARRDEVAQLIRSAQIHVYIPIGDK